MLQLALDPACQLVHFADPVDLVAEPLDTQDKLAPLRGEDLYRIPPALQWY